jgi:hypothetical protein
MSHGVSKLSVTCAVIRARGVHSWLRWVVDDAPDPLAVLLVVDHLDPCVDVPDTHTPFIVAGGKMVLVVGIEEYRTAIK